MSDGLGDLFDEFFGKGAEINEKLKKPKPETKPIPRIRGKRIEGVLYVHAKDVADALEMQAPKANRRLIDKLRG